MDDYRHDTLECPHCKAVINGSIAVNGTEAPSPGDVTICVHCAGGSIYGDGLTLRLPDDHEQAVLLMHHEYQRARFAVLAMLAEPRERKDDE